MAADAQTLSSDKVDLDSLLAGAFKVNASDIHFHVDQTPRYRVSGQLRSFDIPPTSASDMSTIAKLIAGEQRLRSLPTTGQVEISYEKNGLGRFRASLFLEGGRLAIVLRVIPLKIPDPKALRLPAVMARVVDMDRGLVLITGATGMGKSTTVASLLTQIAQSSAKHILTIEDPIEYMLPVGEGTISQREIGRDVQSYQKGLEAALRQDPDILFIGELRDRATVATALQAAESGHLVFSTFHTSTAITTVTRIAGLFPSEEQASIRIRLADVLSVMMCQKLLPRAKSAGRVLAGEVTRPTPSIVEAICDPQKTRTLEKHIANSRFDHGTQTFDQHLTELYQAGLITMEVAQAAASKPNDFVRALKIMR